MKKALILAAVAALALSACSKNEIIETINKVPEEAPIGFSNYTPKSLTKADDTYVSGTTLVTGKQFAVYAWQTNYNNFLAVNPGTPGFMNPAVVTWNDDTTDGDGNTYTPLRYWPSGDEPANLSFTAYYPYGGAGITAPTFDTGVGTYAFTAQAAPDDMVDFCVADVVNDQVYGSTNAGSSYKSTVKFTFKHQLTKVQFKFKTIATLDPLTKIKVTEIKLNNVKTTGTLTATYAQAAAPQAVNKLGTTTTSWGTSQGTPATYDITVDGTDVSSTDKLDLTKDASTVDESDIFLMLPQETVAKTGSNPQTLVVTWEVITYDSSANATTNDGATGVVSKTTNVKTLYLDEVVLNTAEDGTGSAVADNDWDMNESIVYIVTIGPQPIYFTGVVNSWEDDTYGLIDVN